MKENTMQETKFRVGQTVWCLLYGKGRVVDIDDTKNTFPVMVEFDTGESDSYSTSGKSIFGTNRTLFFSEPKIEAATEPVFEPKLVGKVVAVWCNATEDFVETGEVAYEYENSLMLTDGSSYSKDYVKYSFHEVTPQPYTFD